ncbi:DUF5719 family protein [Isoptericola hypogeus]|uniref:DUF5719 family protein n=1 Tax=Isoptericola hypogeus TaxID=300179 RepID=A0ABP4URB4_9MICO
MTSTTKRTAGRLPTTARRVVAGVTGVAAVAALGLVATLGDQWAQAWTGAEERAVAAGTRSVAVQPAEEALVCPAPVKLPDGADVGDSQFSATPVPTRSGLGAVVLGGAAGGTGSDGVGSEGDLAPRTTDLGAGDAAPLAGDPGAVAQQGAVDGVRVLRATPVPEEEFRAAGSLASVTTQGDLRGLAAGSCASPGTSLWLVGGRTTVGTTTTLTVQNPTERPATVTLDVYGPSGPVALGGGGTFTVAAHEQVATRLESVAPEQDRLVVHVGSTGARVAASLQRQAIDGLVPAGTDLVTAGASPRASLAVGGVVSHGETLDDPHAPRLRLLAPGTDESGTTTARVSVYGPSGEVALRGADEVELDAGVVTDLPLGGLPAGAYTVVVDADAPVVGGARFDRAGRQPDDSVVGGTPYDVAWSRAQSAGSGGAPGAPLGTLALPPEVQAQVTLAGVPGTRDPEVDPAGEAAVTVRSYDAAGAEVGATDLTVPAGSTVTVPASELTGDGSAPVAVRVDRADTEGSTEGAGGVGVVWSAVLSADDGTATTGTLVAVLAPTPALTAAGDVAVRSVDAAG